MDLKISNPVRVGEGVSTLDGDCNQSSDGFTYRDNVETDVRLEVDPENPDRMAIAFMRDPVLAVSVAWSVDGGSSWKEVDPSGHSPCSGPGVNTFGDQDLAVDAEGRIYLVSVQGQFEPAGQPMEFGGNYSLDSRVVVSVSDDFGVSWSPPALVSDFGSYQHTATIAAVRSNPGVVVAHWHVQENKLPVVGESDDLEPGMTYTAYSRDRGATWSKPEQVSASLGALDILSSDEGSLFAINIDDDEKSPDVDLHYKHGSMPWRRIASTADDRANLPVSRIPMKTNTSFFVHPEGLPILATDNPGFIGPNGQIYLVLSEFDSNTNSGRLRLSVSKDQGQTWSAPRIVAEVIGPIWNAAVAVAPDGVVGVLWYDSRTDIAKDGQISAQPWFAVSSNSGETWLSASLSKPFDLTQAPAPHTALYLGNYFEIKPVGPSEFAVPFVVAPPLSTGPSDIWFSRVQLVHMASD